MKIIQLYKNKKVMAISYVFGDSLVGAEELAEIDASGELSRFNNESEKSDNAKLKLRSGTITVADIHTAQSITSTLSFTPLKIGGPLSIEILTVYTGDAPKRKFLQGKPDLLVVSGVKGVQTFEAAPRAINQIVEDVKDNMHLEASALRKGSPIVYYSPAIDFSTVLCSLELVVDTFNGETFTHISKLFNSAAGLPVFAPASSFLIAGSFITKIAGDLGKALLESKPFLSADLTLRYDTPLFNPAFAGQIVLHNDRNTEELQAYKPGIINKGNGKEKASLINKESGKEYQGSAPYVILSLDGRTRSDLDSFTPKLASASLLEKFYGANDIGGEVVTALDSAMELYNDFSYRLKAENLKKKLKSLNKDSGDYKKMKILYNAYVGNIRKDLFKLDSIPTK